MKQQKRSRKNCPNKQKKYLLPEGVSYKEDSLPSLYNKETELIFIDAEFGEFTGTIKNLHRAKASIHPKAVQKRREATNTLVYGGVNPSNSKEVRKKAQKTMVQKYGVEHALKKQEFIDKSKSTLMQNYGVKHPFHSPEIVEKYFKTLQVQNKKANSTGERELLQFIHDLGILDAKSGYLGGSTPCEIDIKINSLNIGIEFNGVYFHSEAKKENYIQYHLNKTKYAKSYGLELIHIFDYEWNERKEQVKSFLTSKLGKNKNLVYARKCELRQVSKQEAKTFLDTYHILGSCNFIKAYGLYLNNELLSMITIGRHHRNGKQVVLSRFIGKTNYTVVGGLSKLCKAAHKEFGDFITWIDRRWSTGQSWLNNGWELEQVLPPDYFYYDTKKHTVVSKQKRKKSVVNTPDTMTEHEHALQDKLYRVYDCGKLRLVYKG